MSEPREPIMPEYKSVIGKLETKEIGNTGRVEGYASIFDTPDAINDVVKKGFFKKTLKEKLPVGRIKFLVQHDTARTIGIIADAGEDSKGLWFVGDTDDSFNGVDTFKSIRSGALNEMSFMFETVKSEMDENDTDAKGYPRRDLIEGILYEISPVTFGMHSGTNVDAVKAKYKSLGIPFDPGVEAAVKQALEEAENKEDEEILEALKACSESIKIKPGNHLVVEPGNHSISKAMNELIAAVDNFKL